MLRNLSSVFIKALKTTYLLVFYRSNQLILLSLFELNAMIMPSRAETVKKKD